MEEAPHSGSPTTRSTASITSRISCICAAVINTGTSANKCWATLRHQAPPHPAFPLHRALQRGAIQQGGMAISIKTLGLAHYWPNSFV